MDELTVSEINTLIEAVDAWTTASQTSSMLAGLFMGALICKDNPDGDTECKEVVNKFLIYLLKEQIRHEILNKTK